MEKGIYMLPVKCMRCTSVFDLWRELQQENEELNIEILTGQKKIDKMLRENQYFLNKKGGWLDKQKAEPTLTLPLLFDNWIHRYYGGKFVLSEMKLFAVNVRRVLVPDP